MRRALVAVALTFAAGACSLNDLPPPAPPPDTAAVRPALRPYSDELAATLKVPAGFRVSTFARDLAGSRMLAAGPDGSVYVTSPAQGRVTRLFDADGNGDARGPGEATVVADAATTSELAGVHGVAIAGDRIYLASTGALLAGRLAGGGITNLRVLADDLPDSGDHGARTVAIGPEGNLYLGVASGCNACRDGNSEHASLLRLTPDGAPAENPPSPKHPVLAQDPRARVSARVFASGLRATLGFDWHPVTGALWGADDGRDGLGDDTPPEEINLLAGGRSYGWPYCFADERVDPDVDDPSQAMTKAAYCAGTMVPLATLPAHSEPVGFTFYRGAQFPATYVGDAFIALHGSRDRETPSGFEVIRLHFIAGQPAAIPGTSSSVQRFLDGFLLDGGQAQFGRVAGLAVDASGALLVAEDANGVVYRVTYAPEAAISE